ncbi:BC1872 family protein [Maridesulfovibrio sp.]|uniref:BC1872 family protein n=1 Tax=Maridesulfovibrio sp. TaxID=2795000 RepID=UPI002AA7BB51|nr:hypothetical protein [Maridesulfovibrio sp.]
MKSSQLSKMVTLTRGEKWFYLDSLGMAYCTRCNCELGCSADGDSFHQCDNCQATATDGGKDYAEDLNAAQELVEEMESFGGFEMFPNPDGDGYVFAFIPKNGRLPLDGIGETLPEAICKAFLIWKGFLNEK